ncbi:MAG: hypothetical protein ACM3VS_02635 [Candidatus Dadabacteria bacterium]
MKDDINISNSEFQMEEKLWEYIDGTLSSSELPLIDQLVKSNAEWIAKYHELLEINDLLHNSELEQPSLRFTKNVMEEIARTQIAPATKEYINNKIIVGIAAFFITVITSFIIYGISQINWSASGSDSNLLGIDFKEVDYSVIFDNQFVNIFLMLNVVLGLMLLDRFLNSKRKKMIGAYRYR